MGLSGASSPGRQHPSKGQRKVLQGSCAVGPSLRQRDMEPHQNRTGAVGRVSHQGCLPDGKSPQALERTKPGVGLPSHRRRAQGVWDALYLALYWRQAGDNLQVRSGQADPSSVSGG